MVAAFTPLAQTQPESDTQVPLTRVTAMAKIKLASPVVELDCDEMARISGASSRAS
jgi:hypothetical protein